jgi:TPR repeat protein
MDTQQTFSRGLAAYNANDFAAAADMLIPLANSGHSDAQYIVGDMYRWGYGVGQSNEQTLQFLKASADQGQPKAAFDLFLLLNPTGRSAPDAVNSLPKDATESKRYLDLAVKRFTQLGEQGDVDAMNYLGFLYHQGWAFRWMAVKPSAGTRRHSILVQCGRRMVSRSSFTRAICACVIWRRLNSGTRKQRNWAVRMC